MKYWNDVVIIKMKRENKNYAISHRVPLERDIRQGKTTMWTRFNGQTLNKNEPNYILYYYTCMRWWLNAIDFEMKHENGQWTNEWNFNS